MSEASHESESPQVVALDAPDATLHVTHWPVAHPRAVVHIVHGMVEYGQRYAPFAEFLNSRNIAVVAHDHRGHGQTKSAMGRGIFALDGGWDTVVADVDIVRQWVDQQYQSVPHFILGHSMGSIIVRNYLAHHGKGLAGAIVMGTATWPGLKGDMGLKLAQLLTKLRPTATGTMLNNATFAGYNNGCEKRTEFDWLSRDHAQVDAYIADPDCGFVPTNTFFRDLLIGTRRANADDTYAAVPTDLPIMVVSGAADPVGGAAAVAEVAGKYRTHGMASVDDKTYPGGRHEVLNETNRAEVFEDLAEWIDAHITVA